MHLECQNIDDHGDTDEFRFVAVKLWTITLAVLDFVLHGPILAIKTRRSPSMTPSPLRDFLEIPYDQLEEMNLQAKEDRLSRQPADEIQEQRMRYLRDEKRIKAVTVCFTDLEGRLHMLDYDKKFLLKSADNLTFDGSSIRGFSQQAESDLRLAIDWLAFYWLPSDIFGSGKVLVFGEVDRKSVV
jgi:hypothetical protein